MAIWHSWEQEHITREEPVSTVTYLCFQQRGLVVLAPPLLLNAVEQEVAQAVLGSGATDW